MGDGWAEFIDFNTRKFYKALTYKKYAPEGQYSLTNAQLFFDLFSKPAQATTRIAKNNNGQTKTADIEDEVPVDPNGGPIIDPATVLPLLTLYNKVGSTSGYVTVTDAITDLEMYYPSTSGGPGTGCSKKKKDGAPVSGDGGGFWNWVSGIFGDIVDFFEGMFGGNSDSDGADAPGTNPYPNILLDDSGNTTGNSNDPTAPNSNIINNSIPGYGPNNPVPPVWHPVDPNVSAPPNPLLQSDNYVLTEADQKIWDEIAAEDAEVDAVFNKDCQGTMRSGNIQWPGTLEHWIIMMDYIVRTPFVGEIEYQIPGAGVKMAAVVMPIL